MAGEGGREGAWLARWGSRWGGTTGYGLGLADFCVSVGVQRARVELAYE